MFWSGRRPGLQRTDAHHKASAAFALLKSVLKVRLLKGGQSDPPDRGGGVGLVLSRRATSRISLSLASTLTRAIYSATVPTPHSQPLAYIVFANSTTERCLFCESAAYTVSAPHWLQRRLFLTVLMFFFLAVAALVTQNHFSAK